MRRSVDIKMEYYREGHECLWKFVVSLTLKNIMILN